MACEDQEDESLEHTLLVVREVFVYKIPARSSSGGYKCGEWLQSDKIWCGRLRVVSLRDNCEVRLEDSNTGELFASCPVHPGKREATVEGVADSSRYFVLRIDDGRGKHAFIGLGFTERNEAFDFNVALSDHEKYAKRTMHNDNFENEEAGRNDSASSLDLRLKEGETLRINVKTRPSASAGMLSGASSTTAGSIASVGHMKAPLAPPPGGGRIRSPLPPPPNDTKPIKSSGSAYNSASRSLVISGTYQNSTDRRTELERQSGDIFSDLSELKLNLPTGANVPSNKGSGWAAF
ncbi:hypothetical protein O6H91_02G052700 [Diphasiastrum complanatum]|uniref:Uncharacterized protein n=1 Tax=Diphasiastrum complanatum TaxID=34168 RepID=A0ACC2EFM6_DIPCM|nr:hypothetical protein O6H91_02G052700 [Diphasiastrum complanatum]